MYTYKYQYQYQYQYKYKYKYQLDDTLGPQFYSTCYWCLSSVPGILLLMGTDMGAAGGKQWDNDDDRLDCIAHLTLKQCKL